MRYLPTIDLWKHGIQEAIARGQIKIQRGQWCQCGDGPKSRFVRMMGQGVIHVVHWQGTGEATNNKFLSACNSLRGR